MSSEKLLQKTIDDKGLTWEQISEITGIPTERLEVIRKDVSKAVGVEIQTLSSALEMPDNLRRVVWFNRDLPLD